MFEKIKKLFKKRKFIINKNTLKQFNNLPKMFGIIMVIFIIFYLITLIITGSFNVKEKENENEEVAIIQYNEILVGEIFNKLDDEYYVLLYDFEGNDAIFFNTLVSLYNNKNNNIPLYIVNTSNGFNVNYINQYIENNDLYNINIIIPTLIKITINDSPLYIEGKKNMVDILRDNL